MAIIIGQDKPSIDANDSSADGSKDPLVGSANPEERNMSAPNGGEYVKESSSSTFAEDVIEASMETPIIVDFWAPWCEPCKQLGPMLEKLVNQAGGLIRMAKVNIDENQELAAQMRVQSIPMVYAFSQGQPVDGFQGAIPESQLKEFIKRLTGGAKPPIESALENADLALEANNFEEAITLFSQVLEADETNSQAYAGLIRCAITEGKLDHARQIAEQLPPKLQKDQAIRGVMTALELAEMGGSDDDTKAAELLKKLELEPENHQARLDYALAVYGTGQNDAAIDALIEIIRKNRTWNDEAARIQLLKIFEALGHNHPATIEGRKKLSAVLFS